MFSYTRRMNLSYDRASQFPTAAVVKSHKLCRALLSHTTVDCFLQRAHQCPVPYRPTSLLSLHPAEVQGDFLCKPARLFPFLLAENCHCCFVSFLYQSVMFLGLHLISPYESPSSGYPLFVSLFSREKCLLFPHVSLSSIDFVSWMSDYATFTTMKRITRANAFVVTN